LLIKIVETLKPGENLVSLDYFLTKIMNTRYKEEFLEEKE